MLVLPEKLHLLIGLGAKKLRDKNKCGDTRTHPNEVEGRPTLYQQGGPIPMVEKVDASRPKSCHQRIFFLN